ncbi:MAG: AmmeMemoRadiSam system radical SAM enzyme [Candidatus Micrarchaeia archaeon]
MREASLYRKMPGRAVSCYLCQRRCYLKDGETGFCHVRQNIGGTLQSLNYGKCVSYCNDPIEKKPFYHFMPGSQAFSFAAAGCNFRCEHCFTKDNSFLIGDEILFAEEFFEKAESKNRANFCTISHLGKRRAVIKASRHHHDGEVYSIKPRYAPPIECTPEHGFYVFEKGSIQKKNASELREGELLVIPKLKASAHRLQTIDAKKILGGYLCKIKKGRKTDRAMLEGILAMKRAGATSRQIGRHFRMHPTYIRKLSIQIEKSGIDSGTFYYDNEIMEENDKVRFKTEKGGGIPGKIKVDEKFAELLGYFCAEGSVHKFKSRPNSMHLVFSFGQDEQKLASRTVHLIKEIFGLDARIFKAPTGLRTEIGKASLAALLMHLCGTGAKNKKVPACIASSGESVIRAFLKAVVEGDGTILENNIAIDTVSKRMAHGLYYLFLLCGYLPSFYAWDAPKRRKLLGRIVNQSTLYYVKITAERFRNDFLGLANAKIRRKSEGSLKFKETNTHWLVPVFKIQKRRYSGYVYNMEVEGEHSYLTGFVGVANCQNWEISQPAQIFGQELPPEKLVELALAHRSKGIAYTYTEPTIFYEYAEDTAKLAHKKGLYNVFVTNGYETPEAIEGAKWLDAARIDLKAFTDRFYKEVCGDAHLEPVLKSIKGFHSRMHVEIITLLIPTQNDSDDEIRALCQWVKGLDADIPLHFTGYYPSNRMTLPPTPGSTLLRARKIAMEEGLEYVYTGNRPGDGGENTLCPKCGALAVERLGFEVVANNLTKDARCGKCGEKLPFVLDWKKSRKG